MDFSTLMHSQLRIACLLCAAGRCSCGAPQVPRGTSAAAACLPHAEHSHEGCYA